MFGSPVTVDSLYKAPIGDLFSDKPSVGLLGGILGETILFWSALSKVSKNPDANPDFATLIHEIFEKKSTIDTIQD